MCMCVLSASYRNERRWRGIYRHPPKSNRYNIIARLGDAEKNLDGTEFALNVETFEFLMRPIYKSWWYQFDDLGQFPILGGTEFNLRYSLQEICQLTTF